MLRVIFNVDITQQIGLTNEMIQYNRRTYRKRAMANSRTVIIPTNKNGWISVKRKVLKKKPIRIKTTSQRIVEKNIRYAVTLKRTKLQLIHDCSNKIRYNTLIHISMCHAFNENRKKEENIWVKMMKNDARKYNSN